MDTLNSRRRRGECAQHVDAWAFPEPPADLAIFSSPEDHAFDYFFWLDACQSSVVAVSEFLASSRDVADVMRRTLPLLSEAFGPDRVRELEHEVRKLREQEQTLQSELMALRGRVQTLEQGAAEVVVLRELTRDQARDELLAYFREHSGAYPSDAAVALRLDSAWVRDLCNELVDEGLLDE